jgi:hypothetical protein
MTIRLSIPRRCETCHAWSPLAGDAGRGRQAMGTCSDPVTRARPENAGVAGDATVLHDGGVVVRRDAVCPRFRAVVAVR